MVTTHSPYILSSVNNLMYAYQVGTKKEVEVAARIPKDLWLDGSRVQAFFVDEGVLKDIIDAEQGLIKEEALDSASALINEDYEFLFELDDLHE